MRLHPLLADPEVVVVSRTKVPAAPSRADFARAAAQVLDAVGLRRDGGGGHTRVVIKPNLTTAVQRADPDDGISTHPHFIRGMVEHLHARGVPREAVAVLEDPLDEDHDGPRDWARTGFQDIADELGCELVSTTLDNCVERPVPRPLAHTSRRVASLAVDPDVFLINVPKLKTHTWAITTVCMKNLMGVDYQVDRHYCSQSVNATPGLRPQPGREKNEWLTTALHRGIQENLGMRLADLSQVVQPELNVVEGVIGRDGTGFQRGANWPLGLCIAGTNAVAVDAAASYLMGFDPAKLAYLTIAADIGLGTADMARLKVYVADGGELEFCPEPRTLRITPAFRVITDLVDENPDTYR